MEPFSLSLPRLFVQESILFLQLSRRLCEDRSLFPEQRTRRQAADTWRVFIPSLPCTLCSLESCLDRVFYLRSTLGFFPHIQFSFSKDMKDEEEET